MSPHWRGWFALGVLRFGLNPELFWRLSVLEWRALCAALAPGARRRRTGVCSTR